jgi:hypothetical protein
MASLCQLDLLHTHKFLELENLFLCPNVDQSNFQEGPPVYEESVCDFQDDICKLFRRVKLLINQLNINIKARKTSKIVDWVSWNQKCYEYHIPISSL